MMRAKHPWSDTIDLCGRVEVTGEIGFGAPLPVVTSTAPAPGPRMTAKGLNGQDRQKSNGQANGTANTFVSRDTLGGREGPLSPDFASLPMATEASLEARRMSVRSDALPEPVREFSGGFDEMDPQRSSLSLRAVNIPLRSISQAAANGPKHPETIYEVGRQVEDGDAVITYF